MVEGYVYRHYIIINGVERNYVGKTTQTLQQRWRNGTGYKRHSDFWIDIQKYGWDNFKHEVLETVQAKTKKDLKVLLSSIEQKYIEKFDSVKNGYNKNTGGDQGYVQSRQTVEKRSNSLKGKLLSDEHKKKISENHARLSGGDNPCSKKIVCVNTGKVFNSLSEAAKWCGLKSSAAICNQCKGKTRWAGKHPKTGECLQWKYYEEDFNELLNSTKQV